MSTSDAASLSINVKGPQDVSNKQSATFGVQLTGTRAQTKLAVSVPASATVLELKALIEEGNSNFPADSQRLIYSGRVLKDEDLLSKYSLKDGHTIHLVSGSSPPSRHRLPELTLSLSRGRRSRAVDQLALLLESQQLQASLPTLRQGSRSPGTLSLLSSTLRTPVLSVGPRGLLPGPELTRYCSTAGFNPFAEMGINPRDPNMVRSAPLLPPSIPPLTFCRSRQMQNMMNDPAVQANIGNLLADPAVIDQVVRAPLSLSRSCAHCGLPDRLEPRTPRHGPPSPRAHAV